MDLWDAFVLRALAILIHGFWGSTWLNHPTKIKKKKTRCFFMLFLPCLPCVYHPKIRSNWDSSLSPQFGTILAMGFCLTILWFRSIRPFTTAARGPLKTSPWALRPSHSRNVDNAKVGEMGFRVIGTTCQNINYRYRSYIYG